MPYLEPVPGQPPSTGLPQYSERYLRELAGRSIERSSTGTIPAYRFRGPDGQVSQWYNSQPEAMAAALAAWTSSPTGNPNSREHDANYLPPGSDTPGPGTVDRDNFRYPYYEENRNELNSRLGDVRARTAPTIGTQTRDPLAQTTFQGTTAGRLGSAEPMGPAPTMGPYSSASGARASAGIAKDVRLDPQKVAEDSAVRGNLMEGLDYQGRLMRGEDSVAAKQMARDQEYAISNQMGMARAARPGLAAMANRDAALNTGRLQADFGSRLAQAQLAERNEAAQRYSQYGGLIREQDLGLSQFNAGEGNRLNIAQGGISKDVGISNAANQTQASIASAQNATQASITNAKNSLDAAIKRGDWESAAQLQKYIQDNENIRTQGRLDTDVNVANMTTGANVALANTDAANRYSGDQQKYLTDVDKTNAELAINSQRNSDLMEEGLLRLKHDIDSGEMQGAMAYEDLLSKYGLVAMKGEIDKVIEQMGIDAKKAMQPATWERILGAVVPIIAARASRP